MLFAYRKSQLHRMRPIEPFYSMQRPIRRPCVPRMCQPNRRCPLDAASDYHLGNARRDGARHRMQSTRKKMKFRFWFSIFAHIACDSCLFSNEYFFLLLEMLIVQRQKRLHDYAGDRIIDCLMFASRTQIVSAVLSVRATLAGRDLRITLHYCFFFIILLFIL